ncbi:biotin--[acetyl-CoA-carboxylase] ligase [Candidatus Sumerlaeota bacterium]|nr:biotin--[acetyl-CoA-carboxylase] ligase [Candidatus Sumerlaeota bacterium]
MKSRAEKKPVPRSDASSLLDRDLIKEVIEKEFPDVVCHVYRETGSTNDRAKDYLKHVKPGAPPAVIAAESQRAGRGRHGRKWQSPPFVNLLFSIALTPEWAEGIKPETANLAAANLICKEIKSHSRTLRLAIKWPNDVEIDGKKIAGILAESSAIGLVIGIGLNVNMAAEQIPAELRAGASSLRIASGREWPRENLLAGIALRLLKWIKMEEPDRSASAQRSWLKRCEMLGHWVRVRQGHTIIEGTVEDITPDGTMILKLADGAIRRLASGEVTLRVH